MWPDALPKAARDCIHRYHNAHEFLKTFNPDRQCEYSRDIIRSYTGAAPNLGVVGIAFGYDTAITWLMAQLRNVSEFTGVTNKMTPRQANEVAEIIYSQWGYLKVTELMHFFVLLKAGYFGKFYGAVDGMVITEAIHEYLEMRGDIRRKIDAARDEAADAIRKARHDIEVRLFRKCLSSFNMRVEECVAMIKEYGITTEEASEIGWLLRIY